MNKKYYRWGWRYINEFGFYHREDGPAVESLFNIFYYDGWRLNPFNWATKTNHLICKNCLNFCGQRCLMKN